MFLMVTGSSLIPSTQAPSQGAGQTRPVNSTKKKKSIFDPDSSTNSSICSKVRNNPSTREIIRLQKLVQCLGPIIIEYQIVPFGYNVTQRTPVRRLAERYTAFHTTSRLHLQILTYVREIVDFVPVVHTFLDRTIRIRFATVFDETSANRTKSMKNMVEKLPRFDFPTKMRYLVLSKIISSFFFWNDASVTVSSISLTELEMVLAAP